MHTNLKPDHSDALPPASVRAGEAPSQRAVVRPIQDRCDVLQFSKCEIGRDAYPASNCRKAGIGAMVVAGVWLAFYVVAAVYPLASNALVASRADTATAPTTPTMSPAETMINRSKSLPVEKWDAF